MMKMVHLRGIKMNWFDILKNAGLRQSQRQGVPARQKDEDFIFEDEDEEDCRQKIIDEFQKLCQKLYGKSADKREYPGVDYYNLNAASSGRLDRLATLRIEYPKTNKEKEAYCAFYHDFAQGRNAYPPNPKVDEFAKNDWSTVDDIHSIYTKSQRTDMDSPTSNFNYFCNLYDMSGNDGFGYYDKIDVQFWNVPEDAWT